jgi:hypothetical protein
MFNFFKKKDNNGEEKMKAIDLIDRETFVVRPSVPAIPKNKYAMEVKLPEIFVILKIYKYVGGFLELRYFDGKSSRYAIINQDFEFSIVRKKADIEKTLEGYQQFMLRNIKHELGHTFMIGSDPEMFVEDKDGQLIPAFDFLGSKQKPDFTEETIHGGNWGTKPMYWDGYQAEFTTSANTCLAWHVDSVWAGISALAKKAKAFKPGAKLSAKTVFDIPEESLATAAEEHVEFGCMPSYNNYGLSGVKKPGREATFRSAGGHIHFGIGKRTPEEIQRIVYALDAILGVACVAMFAKFDDPRRRVMYGLAGEYRLPPHGLEYRVLSNAWMFHPLIMNLVFDLSRKCVVLGQKKLLEVAWKTTEEETIDCINNCDVEKAKEILDRNKATFIQLLSAAYPNQDDARLEVLFKGFRDGMETLVENPTDIENNWLLNGQWIGHGEAPGKNVKNSVAVINNGKKVA